MTGGFRLARIALLPLALGAVAATAQSAAPDVIPLWTSAVQLSGHDSTDIPAITRYPIPGHSTTHAAVLVCPGGAYAYLAEHEGEPVARWLNGLGIEAFVLRYRLGPRYHYPVPLDDAERAMRLIRSHAVAWNIDPHRVGIIGFSAGGHLASMVATDPRAPRAAADSIDRASMRPDLLILAYPVISMRDSITHRGSRDNLLGTSPPAALVDTTSSERHVNASTPPTFLFATADDPVVPVENTLRFAGALRAAHVPFELHVFQHGAHGVGLAPADPVLHIWTELLAAWLRANHFAR